MQKFNALQAVVSQKASHFQMRITREIFSIEIQFRYFSKAELQLLSHIKRFQNWVPMLRLAGGGGGGGGGEEATEYTTHQALIFYDEMH